jgi:hypothetical protein
MFAHKSVLHLSSQHALVRMAKTPSFHRVTKVQGHYRNKRVNYHFFLNELS